jgi:hypothetical protein
MGLVTEISVPDGVFVVNGVARAIVEIKDNTMTPAEATRQAIAEAVNMAIAQLKARVSSSDIIIPMIGSNGYLI